MDLWLVPIKDAWDALGRIAERVGSVGHGDEREALRVFAEIRELCQFMGLIPDDADE